MIYGFPPVEPRCTNLLILGTMPSVRSLELTQYYGNPQNQFWKLIFGLWDLPSPEDYTKKVSFLHQKQIALWDVLKCCEREGSMDTNIKAPAPNDVASLVRRHPELHTICFNSKNAQTLFETLIAPDLPHRLRRVTLPSSSPARAMKLPDKLSEWSIIRNLLEEEPRDE